jgi:excisionase family DNA binding protein
VTDRLLTAREVGIRLGVSTETVLRWVRQGKLPAFQLGRAIRFREDEIEQWLAERATSERGDVTHPAGRRPPGTVEVVTHPRS